MFPAHHGNINNMKNITYDKMHGEESEDDEGIMFRPDRERKKEQKKGQKK